jgi:hypothetical protein
MQLRIFYRLDNFQSAHPACDSPRQPWEVCLFSYTLLEPVYRKHNKMVKCTFKKQGKCKMKKEVKVCVWGSS